MEIKTRKKKIAKKKEVKVDFLSTGCTMLNLALSGRGRRGGFARGRVFNIVGDGSTGKTLLALETGAQTFYTMIGRKSRIFPEVEEVIIVYNNVESVMDFPLVKMYGEEFVDGVIWISTPYIEEFGRDYLRRVKALEEGQLLLYFTDSWDALKSIEESKRFEKASKEDTDEKKSYNLAKQAYAHKFFRNLARYNEKVGKDATLGIVSQVKQKIDATFFEKKLYRTGGKALDFFTHQVLWLYESGKLKEKKLGHDRIYGINIKARLERSKVSLPHRDIKFPIIFNFGIDDVRSMVDWYYGPAKKSYSWDGEKFVGKSAKAKMINYIYENDQEVELQKICENQWNRIEEAFEPERRKKFK